MDGAGVMPKSIPLTTSQGVLMVSPELIEKLRSKGLLLWTPPIREPLPEPV